jgi:hypothetical protein
LTCLLSFCMGVSAPSTMTLGASLGNERESS